MGNVVSLFEPTDEPPCHIHLAHARDKPFDSPPASPPLPFYTAPSTPLTSPQQEDPPLDALQQVAAPPSPPPPNPRLQPALAMETIPPADVLFASDLALDFTLDDEALSTLEKIYLFSRSRSAHHRCALCPPPLAHVYLTVTASSFRMPSPHFSPT